MQQLVNGKSLFSEKFADYDLCKVGDLFVSTEELIIGNLSCRYLFSYLFSIVHCHYSALIAKKSFSLSHRRTLDPKLLEFQYTINSLYCGHHRDRELVSLIASVRPAIAGIYFSQTSVIYFCRGFSCCPYYRGVRNSEVSARQELTVTF